MKALWCKRITFKPPLAMPSKVNMHLKSAIASSRPNTLHAAYHNILKIYAYLMQNSLQSVINVVASLTNSPLETFSNAVKSCTIINHGFICFIAAFFSCKGFCLTVCITNLNSFKRKLCCIKMLARQSFIFIKASLWHRISDKLVFH